MRTDGDGPEAWGSKVGGHLQVTLRKSNWSEPRVLSSRRPFNGGSCLLPARPWGPPPAPHTGKLCLPHAWTPRLGMFQMALPPSSVSPHPPVSPTSALSRGPFSNPSSAPQMLPPHPPPFKPLTWPWALGEGLCPLGPFSSGGQLHPYVNCSGMKSRP